MSLTAAITNLNTTLRGLAGMKNVPTHPPESVNEFPFGIAFAGTGRAEGGSMGRALTDETHQITAEIHVQRKNLPIAVETVTPYWALFVTALQADPTLGGEVDLIESIDYEFGPMSWASEEPNTVGYRFSVGVRLDNC